MQHRGRPHPENDLLGEGDPDLLVVNEIAIVLQRLDGARTRAVIATRVQRQTVPLAEPSVALGTKLRPGPKEREIHVEENGLQHRIEDRSSAEERRRSIAGGGLRPPGGHVAVEP